MIAATGFISAFVIYVSTTYANLEFHRKTLKYTITFDNNEQSNELLKDNASELFETSYFQTK